MQLGVDLVQMSAGKQIDKAIIIASDSDFIYAIEKAKSAGVVTTLVYFSEHDLNKTLLMSTDERLKIDEAFLAKCLYN